MPREEQKALILEKHTSRLILTIKRKDYGCYLCVITPGGGAAPSTPSWILRRCRGVAVVGFLQNNTGRGVGVPRRLRREKGFELFLPPSPDCGEFGESGLRSLPLEGVELFLPPVQIALSSANQG
ncbi:hypothetical protein AgCh_023819 [Apium graveolens]